jgi:transcription elongation factor/antiterminator RfaH
LPALENMQVGNDARQGAKRISGRRWYVAATEPKKHGLAVQNLERQFFRCVCPYIQRVRRHARRTENVLVPLFPGYIFVNFDIDKDRWRSINGTLGVIGLISFDQARPRPMPDEAMASLLEKYCSDSVASEADDLRSGDSVMIISGPFADQYATVERLDDKGRVRLLFDILGGTAGLCLNTNSVIPVANR